MDGHRDLLILPVKIGQYEISNCILYYSFISFLRTQYIAVAGLWLAGCQTVRAALLAGCCSLSSTAVPARR